MDEYAARQKIFELWNEGEGALRGGWYEQAEGKFAAALDVETKSGLPGWTSLFWLGKTYRAQSKTAEAVAAFEGALPLRAAALSLISLFRVEAKAHIKAKNRDAARRLFDAMLSLSHLARLTADLAKTDLEPEAQDARAAEAVAEIRAKAGTFYVWSYARDGAVPEDNLLSNRDYATMHKLAFGED